MLTEQSEALARFYDFRDGAVDESKIEAGVAKCCLCTENADVFMHWNGQSNRYFYTFCYDHSHTLWEALNFLQKETVTILPIPDEIKGSDKGQDDD